MEKFYKVKKEVRKPKPLKKKKVYKKKGGNKKMPTKVFMPRSYKPRNNNPINWKGTPNGLNIKGTELWSYVVGTSAFNVSSGRIKINPGDLTMGLPRLKTQSNLYEFFKFNTLTIRYEPSVSSLTDGEFIMCTDYDINIDPPTSTQTMLAQSSGKLFLAREPFLYKFDTRSSRTMTNKHRVLHSDDEVKEQSTYYPAQIWLASEAFAVDKYNAGYIYIDYDVTFYDAYVSDQGIPFNISAVFNNNELTDRPFPLGGEDANTYYIGDEDVLRELASDSYSDVNEPIFVFSKKGRVTMQWSGIARYTTAETGYPLEGLLADRNMNPANDRIVTQLRSMVYVDLDKKFALHSTTIVAEILIGDTLELSLPGGYEIEEWIAAPGYLSTPFSLGWLGKGGFSQIAIKSKSKPKLGEIEDNKNNTTILIKNIKNKLKK